MNKTPKHVWKIRLKAMFFTHSLGCMQVINKQFQVYYIRSQTNLNLARIGNESQIILFITVVSRQRYAGDFLYVLIMNY